MWTIVFTSVQISSRHQTLYRVLCLSQSLNGRAYFPPPSVIFSQDSIAWKDFFINLPTTLHLFIYPFQGKLV